MLHALIVTIFSLATAAFLLAQDTGRISGRATDPVGAVIVGARITLTRTGLDRHAITDEQGNFTFSTLEPGDYHVRAEAKGFAPISTTVTITREPVVKELQFLQLSGQKSVVIVSATLDPGIEHQNDEVYNKTLFQRDDQLLETLDGGINAGQHEGGGKSLEVRRFGFNLDHGGVNGGLKVVVNDLPQNQASQGHGQGYLGALKTLTPELVQEVTILNGPFSAEYGDFSGLGVVQIRTRESLPEQLTARIQAGSFDTFRSFVGYSPELSNADAFIAYEGSYTNGPFLNHLRYKRNNATGNYTWHLTENQDLGFKINSGTNDFASSGQIPLDLVATGELDRFGYIDPSDGGRVRMGTAAAYYRTEFNGGDSFKADVFVGRSLFDLYSNFTFFLNDPEHGDGIQQHDSRLQEGANIQYQHFYRFLGARTLLTIGGNYHENQVNVSLYPREGREPLGVTTRSHLVFPNVAGYAQQVMDFLGGRLHVEGGLRWDYFQWNDQDQVTPSISGTQSAARLQPKAAIAYNIARQFPVTLSFNYGRGINTQDARGIVERPDSPRIATTDFYQAGAAYNFHRFSFSTDLFLIDRSNEQVYIPDDGTLELKGPSRSYGYEGKTSLQLLRRLSLEGGITQVMNSFYRGTSPSVYVDSAPHTVANAGLTLSEWHGCYASVRYRHTSNYRLDGLDPTIRATGLDVIDLAVTKKLGSGTELNLAIDNLTNKKYYETQNYFESRVTPDAPAASRIHGTPGYPFAITLGITFHPLAKTH